jgi:hypothetical protein
MCRTGNFNLSYDSLTSYEARQKLRELKTTDPDFWNELTQKTATEAADTTNDDVPEDEDISEPLFEDDSDLPCDVIIARVHGSIPTGTTSTPDGNLVSTAVAESLDAGDETESLGIAGESSENALGRGKRKVTKNKLYHSFWRHNDGDASDCEEGA